MELRREMVQDRPDPSIVHSTRLKEWLRSEGLLTDSELARAGKNIPDVVQGRVLKRWPEALAARIDSRVISKEVIPACPRDDVQPSCLTVNGPPPKVFSRIARHLAIVVHELRGGRVFVGHHRTTAILDQERYLDTISSAAAPWIAPLLARAPFGLRIDGTVAVLYANGANMFSHWMFDLLPKIEVLRRAGWTEKNVDFFLVNPPAADFKKESFRILGIPEHKILMAEGLLVEAENIVLPSRIRLGFKTPPWAVEFVRDRFGPPAEKSSETEVKLYISRALARGRRVENEDAIRHILERRGYRTVYAEKHSMQEFAKLVARAQAIAAPHGAGLANVVFAPPGVQVLEMYGAKLIQEGWFLTSGVGGQHFLLPGKDHDRRYPWESAEYGAMSYSVRDVADYYVDPSDLECALSVMSESRT